MPHAVRRLRADVQHFFDANFFLLDEGKVPSLRNVPAIRRWVTETVEAEVTEKARSGMVGRSLDGYRILRFDDLYSVDPSICPTFYAYVVAIYNPATIDSDDFYEELLLSKWIRDIANDGDIHLYEKVRRQSTRGRSTMPDGTTKPRQLRDLERLDSKTRKKIWASIRDRHPALMRDIRNLSLVLYYCLSTRQNVVFYTADGDPTSLFLRWLESMSMRVTLVLEVLMRLGDVGRTHVAAGGLSTLALPFDEFVRRRRSLYSGLLDDSHKRSGCRFTLRRWDQNALRFAEDIHVTFEDEIADTLTRIHDNLQCPFTRNDQGGNWLHLVYVWPPADLNSRDLQVTVRRKAIQRAPVIVSAADHNRECLYRRADAADDLYDWSQFG